MLRRTLNLGILAHVDAGKTTLTERLLYAAGVIDAVGSVDDGTTQTDFLTLERQRGITIRSAVVSFEIDDLTVNLVDTPGHPDFIAEVDRVLSVLDGAVLVLSAVEGVQPQTVLLMRALARLRVPTLLFVNKIDRRGADDERVLRAIADRLTPRAVAMGSGRDLGTRGAAFATSDESEVAARLADVADDDGLVAAYLEGELSGDRLRAALAEQTARARVHPVFVGSALTGAGVDAVMAGIAELLPGRRGDPDAPVSGSVFKVERGPAGDKIAYLRMFAGTVRTRDRLRLGNGAEQKVTAINVFERGGARQSGSVAAGQIGKLWGLSEVRVGDAVGTAPAPRRHFAPPTLETVVSPVHADDGERLRAALAQLAEQDPLIDVRQDDDRHELSVSLYGEVQGEVIQATLANEYGLDVTFREPTPICVERPLAVGEAVEVLHGETNPYMATIGLRVEPAGEDSGIELRLDVSPVTVPLHVYKRFERFEQAMHEYVHDALAHGLYGWQVTDCIVTMTHSEYANADGPPSKRGTTTAADVRKLTPVVLTQALARARTAVCEPMLSVAVETPADTVAAVLPALVKLGATVEPPSLNGRVATVEALLPVAQVQSLQRRVPQLTHGEGVVESTFAGYRPVAGEPPRRS